MRTVNDPISNSTGLVDKMIGTAFDVVREVQLNLTNIKYVAHNMAAIIEAANTTLAAAPYRTIIATGTTGALGQSITLLIPPEVNMATLVESSPIVVTASGDVYGGGSDAFTAKIVGGSLVFTLLLSAPAALAFAGIRWRLSYAA